MDLRANWIQFIERLRDIDHFIDLMINSILKYSHTKDLLSDS